MNSGMEGSNERLPHPIERMTMNASQSDLSSVSESQPQPADAGVHAPTTRSASLMPFAPLTPMPEPKGASADEDDKPFCWVSF